VDYISVADLRIPVVNTAEMREVDRLMIDIYGIRLLQMMENAGKNLAELARRLLNGSVHGKRILVAAGKGNNGGGGLVAARHLYNWGANVVVLLRTETLSGVPEIQWSILKKFPLEKKTDDQALKFISNDHSDLILDSMIGYSLAGNPRGWTAKMIECINSLSVPVLALDVPSGLDATSGEIYEPCIQATATMTLALPKTGLVKPEVKQVVGSLYLADISVPDVLYKEMGIDTTALFLNDTIIKLNNL
jgi:NAD(P)H-hydrate epimerase